MNGGEDSGSLLVMNECSGHREITPRGAKPCRLLLTLNLLLIFLALGIAFAPIKVGLRRDGGKYFCLFVFVCFTLYYKLREKN